MLICGIDPGVNGAICFLRHGGIYVVDMPTLLLKKREIDPDVIADLIEARKPDHAFIEKTWARPASMAKAGQPGIRFGAGEQVGNYKLIIGILAALKIPRTVVPPQRWKRALGVPSDKEGARARASMLIPSAACNWPRKKNEGRAEATLIALYGYRQLARDLLTPAEREADSIGSFNDAISAIGERHRAGEDVRRGYLARTK